MLHNLFWVHSNDLWSNNLPTPPHETYLVNSTYICLELVLYAIHLQKSQIYPWNVWILPQNLCPHIA